ncbi:hypothetical protein [Lacrimispora brassicae]
MLYGLKDCANLQIFSSLDNKLKLYCNYAKTSSMEFTSESVFAYNKTTKAVRWDKSREGTFKTTLEIFDMSVLALLFGTEISNGEIPFAKREVLKVTNGTATLVGTPKTGSLTVYKVDPEDKITNIAEQTVGDAAAENNYSINGKVLTLNTNTFADDGYVACYYLVDTPAQSFTVDNASFPGGYYIYGDTNLRGTNQVDEFVQFKLVNCKPQSNVSLNMDSDNVATLEITWDIMSDAEGNMMTWSKIE